MYLLFKTSEAAAGGVFRVNFIKKKLQHRYFPVNITKFLRTPILKNICERLQLKRKFKWIQLNGNIKTG